MRQDEWERLLCREMRPVLYHLVRMGASVQDAEDIVQDTLYKALTHIEAIDPDRIRAWIYRVATNACFSLHGRNRRWSRRRELLRATLEPPPAPDARLLETERNRRVRRTLEGLTPGQRQVLSLRYFCDLSYREIADVLDLTESAVRTYLYRARQAFRSAWREEDGTDEKGST